MRKIIQLCWAKGTKCFYVINYKKAWKHIGTKPKFLFHHNGAKRKNGDTCYDASLIIGYTIFSYTNFDLQREVNK